MLKLLTGKTDKPKVEPDWSHTDIDTNNSYVDQQEEQMLEQSVSVMLTRLLWFSLHNKPSKKIWQFHATLQHLALHKF